MKNMFKKIVCVGLVGLMFLGSVGVAEAKIIQGTKGRTYITMDAIEKSENLEVIKVARIQKNLLKVLRRKYMVVIQLKKNINFLELIKL